MQYYKINLQFQTKQNTPYFIGSQIRGALGFALKKVVCINPSFQCDGCFAKDNCLFYHFYEQKGVYHQYRLDFELGKESYNLNLYLFNEATDKLPYVISALHMLLTQTGLGKEREKVEQFAVSVNDKSIIKNGQIELGNIETIQWIPPTEYKSQATLKLITPLRIKSNNRFVRNSKDLDIKGLINSIYQRQRMLEGKERQKLPFTPTLTVKNAFVNFKDLTRYSSRQKGSLKIGGLLGYIELENIDLESYKLLKLAELIAIGKQTVFGLGKVQLLD